ncbi:MAG: metal-sensitive transcriptional regulator [candidate division KSB1 bacterium]|nr:metal-sensitive transcriptional regulator [candidate division KSB1 bacterium]MDZ7302187.1 metal-sensitive transcriptional regulator [candidate division KSB1 bacterium]MDZ7311296.1 metal-sensitive transcriptional regulator [candidate division KSB1 bacterium]
MTLNSTEKKTVLKRLHHIKGHLAGVEEMLEGDRPIAEIFQQLKAVESALHQAIYVVLDEQLKKQLAEALVRGLEACPGECENCDRLNVLKREFSKLDLKEVVNLLMQIDGSTTQPKSSVKSTLRRQQ